MSGHLMPSRMPVHVLALGFALIALLPLDVAGAQADPDALIKIEVSDSVGLPLPDAKVEVFTFLDGGVFWEWAAVGASEVPAGINLLRFSHPGYRPAMFSVPLRSGSTVSLRVRLMAEHDTTRRTAIEARNVDAIGLAIEGRFRSDIIGHRRIVEQQAIEAEETKRFGALLRRVRNTELSVLPATGGSYRVLSQATSGRSNCPLLVMVNGDRKKVFTFATFDQLYGTHDLELIELFPRGGSIPNAYQLPGSRCGMMAVWFKAL